jgi:hypothetical protein
VSNECVIEKKWYTQCTPTAGSTDQSKAGGNCCGNHQHLHCQPCWQQPTGVLSTGTLE